MFLTVIAASLAFLTLAGCGGSPAPQATDPAEDTTLPSPDTDREATSASETETAEAGTTAEQTEAGQTAYPKDEKLNVLLIGNSFTYYNDMNAPNGILKNVIASAGYNVTVSSVYHGSYYLHQFLDETDSLGK